MWDSRVLSHISVFRNSNGLAISEMIMLGTITNFVFITKFIVILIIVGGTISLTTRSAIDVRKSRPVAAFVSFIDDEHITTAPATLLTPDAFVIT